MKRSAQVVNCSQIFCTFAVETTSQTAGASPSVLWIALKFFVLLQSKQPHVCHHMSEYRCELLSNFLYFCSRNNSETKHSTASSVVNCSQIFCTFAVETTHKGIYRHHRWLWIALKFFVLLQSKQLGICSWCDITSCELLSNFLYFCSRNNLCRTLHGMLLLWIALKFFVLLQSKQLE